MLTGTPEAAHYLFGATVWVPVVVLPLCAVLGWVCAAAALRYATRLREAYAAHGVLLGAAVPASIRLLAVSASVMVLVAAAMLYRLQWGLLFVAHLAVAAVLLVLAIVDARTGLLPDALTLPLMWAALLLSWAGIGVDLHVAVAGAAIGYGLLYGLCWLFTRFTRREGMGRGDFKLCAALGAWMGWQVLLHIIVAACVLGLLHAALRPGTLSWGNPQPFGPYLVAAALTAMGAGPALHSYLYLSIT